ncbi:AraC family transcriptional regulator [Roseibium aggregatum]|uniref:Helix-turn-helix domain-containing protein n=1 Tax=Roseibium aggregatum TaxID=187304 RepID=A0A926P2I7_9HYPH|nr:AraC family transcriptional regulator [Roseibium aggregatum]MBD1545357.1 helix-turn-helix domain-containing protein [Roseibium aggregatum]
MSDGIAFNRAAQLLPFLAQFRQRGGRIDPVLKAAGLEHLDLADSTVLITGNALYLAVEEMAGALNDPYFAARSAEQFVRAGPVFVRESYAVSQTLAEFLPLAVLELGNQITNIRYSLQINADHTVIQGKRAFSPSAPIVQADAAVIGIWVTFLRLVVKEDFKPERLLVSAQNLRGVPPDLIPHSSLMKRKWNGVQVVFPSDWLRRPLDLDWDIPRSLRGEFKDGSPREAVLAYLEKTCREKLSDKAFGLENLAHHLGVHPKSLQRTLAQLGTTFQGIRDKTRYETALKIMATNTPQRTEEIAGALGFSDAASFARAFKRWTGQSPSRYRKGL